jgi:hypothetical protein
MDSDGFQLLTVRGTVPLAFSSLTVGATKWT